MPDLRIFDRITRELQRLGYLKYLLRRVTKTSTSSLENLGFDLIDTVTRKISVPLDEHRVKYIKVRLFDRTYASLKKQASKWDPSSTEPLIVPMELQDLYLADPTLPSGVGKLVKNDWQKYPTLSTNLGLVRAGTYSANTRALSLLHFTSDEEQKGFQEYKPESNPLRLTPSQSLLLLYSLLENDGEAVIPLWRQLPQDNTTVFSDRDAGNFLPEIYRESIKRHRQRTLAADARDRLVTLEKSADSIAQARLSEKYTGGSAREHASRPRLEPYADIGILSKPDLYRYEYSFSEPGLIWVKALEGVASSQEVEEFLSTKFFSTAGQAFHAIASYPAEPSFIVTSLYKAWKILTNSGGYAPIEELALVAGIDALIKNRIVIEPETARQTLISYQKENPYKVRFTVNRMGVLAHARFLEAPDAG